MEGDNERRRSFVNKKTAPYIFLLPMILLFGVFMVYPVIKSLALSFYDFEGGDYLFCGINNYVTMCKDPVFWKSLGNTFIYLAIQVPVMVILSLILGVLVEESFLRFRTCWFGWRRLAEYCMGCKSSCHYGYHLEMDRI